MDEVDNDSLDALDAAMTEATGVYKVTADGIYRPIPSQKGVRYERLTNFTARITGDIVLDDGVEPTRRYELEIVCGGQTSRAEIDADEFDELKWLDRVSGPEVIIYPGPRARAHVAVAIREHSQPVPDRLVYASTGWRERGDDWMYCHAGGAIGSQGSVDGVETGLFGVVARYSLPSPPVGKNLRDAVRASLRVLDIGPDEITVPLYAAVWRGAICAADFAIFAVGPTGSFKSEMAALIQQHYGAGMCRTNLPGSWTSTDNAIEGLLFQTADAVVTIDDYKPAGGAIEVSKTQARAERIFRSIGNGSARQRMNSSAELRPEKPPRGLCIATGEAMPRGQSLRARMLIVPFEQRSIETAGLTACQRHAHDAVYASAMSAYLQWLARRRDEIMNQKRGRIADLVAQFGRDDAHRRTAPLVAELMFGMEVFGEFLLSHRIISPAKKAQLLERVMRALRKCARDQLGYQQAEEPAEYFVRLISDGLASGAAHLLACDDEKPVDDDVSRAVGWRRSDGKWQARGSHIGWIKGHEVFLLPGPSMKLAHDISGAIEPFSAGQQEVAAALDAGGKLTRRGPNRRCAQVQIRPGVRHYVLAVRASEFDVPRPASPLPD